MYPLTRTFLLIISHLLLLNAFFPFSVITTFFPLIFTHPFLHIDANPVLGCFQASLSNKLFLPIISHLQCLCLLLWVGFFPVFRQIFLLFPLGIVSFLNRKVFSGLELSPTKLLLRASSKGSKSRRFRKFEGLRLTFLPSRNRSPRDKLSSR